MARVKIKFPERPANFTTRISIRITDINYGNHLANDKLVALLHEARVQYFRQIGFTEFDIDGVAIIQADLMVVYKGEGFLGEELQFEIFIENITSCSFDMLYRITTYRKDKKIIISEAKTGLVFFDYNMRKIAETPPLFITKIQNDVQPDY